MSAPQAEDETAAGNLIVIEKFTEVVLPCFAGYPIDRLQRGIAVTGIAGGIGKFEHAVDTFQNCRSVDQIAAVFKGGEKSGIVAGFYLIVEEEFRAVAGIIQQRGIIQYFGGGDESFDTLVNTFSPLAIDETRRVLKKGGTFIMAIPGEMHLFDLKRVIYDTPYKNEVADTYLEGFELLEDEHLTYEIYLGNAENVRSLFMMTPYAYRTKPSDKAKVEALEKLKCRADFHTLVYKKL